MTNKTTPLYMLDTNIVSHFIKGNLSIRDKIASIPMSQISISVITEAELLFGLAKMPAAKQLHTIVHEFLLRIESLSWNSASAISYGQLRAELQAKGKLLGNLDLLIAAHALSRGATLITNDKAFAQVDGLLLENWLE